MNMSHSSRLPTVFITPAAKQKLDLYIQVSSVEISGLGTVTRLGNDFLVTDLHLFEQVCTGASTDLSQEAVSQFLLQSVMAGLDPSELKLWWHSHVNMSAFWSGTDDATAGSFGNGWMISVVGNKSGEYLCRLDLYEPIRLTLDGLRFEVRQEFDPELRAAIAAEVELKVRVPQPLITYGQYQGIQPGDVPLPRQVGKRSRRTKK
jgi:hypothetical protein